MKISGRVIQERNISENSETDFVANYKGHIIHVTSDHGHGEPKQDWLTRFDIQVYDKRGCFAVDTWEDCHTIKDAIRSGFKGAMLL